MENDRKTQIIKAAVKRFSKHGVGKTTLDEIARDLRIGKATIYHYFISKEALFYSSVEWESDQYIEEIKTILDNPELTLSDRLKSYFLSKETIDQKYKLIYDLFLLLMKDDTFEKEKEILRSMLRKEKKILETAINAFYGKKELNGTPSLPLTFLITSWGWPFGMKLNCIEDNEKQIQSEELINILIGNILKD